MSDPDRNVMGELAAEWRERLRRGEQLDVEEYAARFPHVADEIRELLPAVMVMEELKPAACDVTGAFGAGGAPSLAGGAGAAAAPGRFERLGDFRILREVGRGGMGVVYEAEQESLGRRVALKVLPISALPDPQQRRRFLREARAAARMHHSNIVPVYGVGEHEGMHYYVMQFIQGQGLDEVLLELRRLHRPATSAGTEKEAPTHDVSAADVARSLVSGRFAVVDLVPSSSEVERQKPDVGGNSPESGAAPTADLRPLTSGAESGRDYWRSVARIGRQVADALHYASSQGILHRDIKPSNLLLDTQGTVWVTDFGLAKVTVEADNLTHTGEIVGTLRYMPPERFNGQSDVRGDIYSLGLTLYEMLALRPAYEDSNRHSLIQQILDHEPPPLRKINPTVPRDLETIVLKATARDPAHRYQSAAELVEDLDRFLDDRPIKARRITVAERLWRWGRRNPALAGALTLAALALLAITVLSVAFNVAQSRSRTELAEAYEQTREQEAQTRLALDESRRLADNLAREQKKTQAALDESRRLARGLDAQQKKTRAALEEARLVSARLFVERGQALVGQRAPHLALLSLARGLEVAPDSAEDLRAVIRTNLAGLRGELPLLRAVLPHDQTITGADVGLGTRGTLLVTAAGGNAARLWDADGKLLAELPHEGKVGPVAFSPDGKFVLTGGADNTARLWDTTSGKQVGEPLPHPAMVAFVAFSPDGKTFLTSCADRKVRLWQTGTGKPVGRPLANDGIGRGVFSPDGKLVLTGFPGRALRLWDAATGKPIGKPLLHAQTAFRAAFSPDGKMVLTGCLDRKARLWDVAGGKIIGEPMEHPDPISPIAFGPDGKVVATGSQLGAVRLWSVPAGKPYGQVGQHSSSILSVTFSPDGRSLMTAGSDNLVRLWDADTVRPVGPSLPHPGIISLCKFSPDGLRLLTVCADQAVRLWELPAGRLARAPLPHRDSVHTVAFSPDGKTVVTGGGDFNQRRGEARLWDVETGQPIGPPLRHSNLVQAVAFSPDGKLVLTGSVDQSARLWDAATGLPVGPPVRHPGSIWRVAFSPDGKTFATAGAGAVGPTRASIVVLWDVKTARVVGRPMPHRQPVQALAFSPDGKRLATGSRDNTVRLWEAGTGRPIGRPLAHLAWVTSVAFSPDSKLLLTGSRDRTARLFDARTAASTGMTLRHQAAIGAVAFSRDGRLLLTAGERVARLWEAATGRPAAPPLQHPELISRAVFSPDSRTVLTGCRDGSMRAWDVRTGQLLGPPLRHHGAVLSVAFHSEGKLLLSGGEDRTARLWTAPLPLRGEPARLARWAEVGIGLELTSDGSPRSLDAAGWQARRQALDKLGGPPDAGSGAPAADSAAQRHRRLAAEHAATGHWFAARWQLDRVLAEQRSDWLAHAERARVLARLGRLEEAAWDCARAAGLGPAEALRDWFARQTPEFDEGLSWEQAGWFAEQLVKARPRDGAAHVLLARARLGLGKPDEAAEAANRAVELGPREEVLARLGAYCEACETREQWQTALWYLDRLAEADPEQWSWHARRGLVLLQLGKYDEATEAYARAMTPLRAVGRRVSTWEVRAVLCLRQGDQDGYRRHCTNLLGVVRSPTPGLGATVAWVCSLGPEAVPEPARFLDLAQKAVEKEPTRAEYLHSLGAALYRAGRFREAAQRLAQSARGYGTEGKVTDWLFLAMAHHRLGNADTARRWLDRAVGWVEQSRRDAPRDAGLGVPVPWSAWLAVHLLRCEAEALIRGTPKTDDVELLLAFARAHARLKQWDKAVADYDRVIEKKKDVRLRVERGRCLLALGQWDKAALDLGEAIAAAPADARLCGERGRCYLRLKQLDRAAEDLARAVELHRAAFAKGQTAAARAALADAYRELAEAQRQQGKPAGAAATLEKLRDLWPGHAAKLVDVARQMVLCLPAQDGAARQRIADLVQATLGQAVLAGFCDAAALRDDAALAPLRERGDFQALLAELDNRGAVPAPGGEIARRPGHDAGAELWALAVSPDGKRAISGGSDRLVRLWEIDSGKELHRLDALSIVWGAAISDDGKRALLTTDDGLVRLWDLASGKVIHKLDGHTGWASPARFLPGGKKALTGGSDRSIRLWDLDSGKEVRRFLGHTSAVRALAVLPGGRRFLSGGFDGNLRLWDVETGKEVGHVEAHEGNIYAVDITADGQLALSAGLDGIIRLWGLAGGKVLQPRNGARELHGHWREILSAVFSADGRRILSIDAARIILWDTASGKELHRFTEAAGQRRAAFLSGRRALTTGAAGRVCLWGLSEEMARACDLARLGQHDRADVEFERIIKSAPGDGWPHLQRGQWLARRGLWDRAAVEAAAAVAARPGDADVLAAAGRLHRRRGDERQARALYEKLLAVRPDPALAAELAGLLFDGAARWLLLEPGQTTATGGTTLARLPDGSILARGKLPGQEVYTITASTPAQGLTAVKLEVLPDGTLPVGGPGRHPSGNFHLSELSVTAAARATPRAAAAVTLTRAVADFQQANLPASNAIDGSATTHWGIAPRMGEAHQALFEAEKPFGGQGGTLLTVRLAFEDRVARQAVLGRFRLWVTTDGDPLRWPALLAHRGVGGWTKLAAAHFARGEWQPALAALEKATASGGTAHDHFLLALLHDRLNRPDDARKWLQQGLAGLDRAGDDQVLRRLAVDALGAALARSPEDVALLARRGHLLARLGRLEQARADYARAARLAPKDERWPVRQAQLQAAALARWSFDYDTDGWQPGLGRHMTGGLPGLRLEGPARDHYLTATAAGPAGWKELTIRARVEEPTVARVLWGTTSARRVVQHGWHSQWFLLPASGKGWRDYRIVCRADVPYANVRLSFREVGRKLEIDSLTLRAGTGEVKDLLRQTTAAVEVRPRDARLLLARGELYALVGQGERAAADLAAARRLDEADVLKRHRTFAQGYENEGNAAAAVVHLGALIDREKGKPGEAALLFRRGNMLGRLGRWEQAAADFTAGLRLNPTDHWNWYRSAALQLYTADRQGYLRTTTQMRQRFGDSNLPLVLERTAKASLLLEGTVDPRVVTALAERAVRGSEAEDGYHWLLLARGMAAYRSGEYREALAWLGKSLEKTPAGVPGDNARALASFWSAMCHGRTEAPAGARAAFQEGVQAMERCYPKKDVGNRVDWLNWLHCELARREAGALLERLAEQ